MSAAHKIMLGLLVGLALLSAGCGRAVRQRIRDPLPEIQPTGVAPEAAPAIEEEAAPVEEMATPTAVEPLTETPTALPAEPPAAPASGVDPTAEAQADALENLLNGLIEQNEQADALDDLP